MKRYAVPFLFLGAMLLPLRLLAAPDDAAVRVEGAVARPGAWTAARLAKDFARDIRPVRYKQKGAEHTARCLPLRALIEAAQPRLDPKARNPALRLVAVIGASDGYTVVFSLGELLPDFGNRTVWIALDMDGAPLSPQDGPVRLLLPDDAKPARWIHGITSIRLVDVAAQETGAGKTQ